MGTRSVSWSAEAELRGRVGPRNDQEYDLSRLAVVECAQYAIWEQTYGVCLGRGRVSWKADQYRHDAALGRVPPRNELARLLARNPCDEHGHRESLAFDTCSPMTLSPGLRRRPG